MSKQTENLKLHLYDTGDKFNITADNNSLNNNMELIDAAISSKADTESISYSTTLNTELGYSHTFSSVLFKSVDKTDDSYTIEFTDLDNPTDSYTITVTSNNDLTLLKGRKGIVSQQGSIGSSCIITTYLDVADKVTKSVTIDSIEDTYNRGTTEITANTTGFRITSQSAYPYLMDDAHIHIDGTGTFEIVSPYGHILAQTPWLSDKYTKDGGMEIYGGLADLALVANSQINIISGMSDTWDVTDITLTATNGNINLIGNQVLVNEFDLMTLKSTIEDLQTRLAALEGN